MGRRRRKNKTRPPKATSPSRARPTRFPYLVGAGLIVAVLALGLIVLLVQSPRSGLPQQLTTGSAAGFNVLVITLDTTRADRLGCYGYGAAETPVLDALAAEGVRFSDAVTVVPVTLPAHATIFTGLDPPNHGVRNNGEFRLTADHPTLAEILGDKGYETAAFVSAFVLDARFGLDRGFDLYDDNVSSATTAAATAFARPIHERPADKVTSAAMRWLKRRDRDRPFFCWVHYFDPHYPYAPPPPFAGRFRDRLYDGEIAYMDTQIGRLLQALETSGSMDSTLIIAVADHGESLGEHDEDTHSKLIYESSMHVPLILSCPGLFRDPHVVDDVVVSIADVFPTLLDLLGIKNENPCDGKTLLSAPLSADRMVYIETLTPYFDSGWSPLYGLRRHGDKYILAPQREYYDLRSDPGESNNLHDKASGAESKARDMLAAELSSRLAKWPGLDGVVASARPLEPEAIRRLESLGYVGSIMGADPNEQLPDPKNMMPVMRAVDRAKGLGVAGRYDEALRVIKHAAAASPNDPKVLLTMGKTYLYMDRLTEAEESFLAANAIRPSARLCILVAQIMLADGRLDQASELLDRAEILDPQYGGIYLARGTLLALQRRPDEAIAAYEYAREIDPHRTGAEAEKRIQGLQEILRRVSPP